MKPSSAVRAISRLLLLIAPAMAGEVRVWTDVQERKIEASLLRTEGRTVVLKLKDGREISYPLDKLSAADGRFVAAADGGKAFNFDAPWPDLVKFSDDPEINTVEENTAKKLFVYESANYRYVCDVRLGKAVVKGFAMLFEATHLYCRTLPLAFNGGEKVNGKYPILLFENIADYEKAGGPPGTAGVFISGKNVVLVPLESLGVKPVGSGYMLDRDKSSNTIPHELTHQLSPDAYFADAAMGWFSEGIAEYIGTTPYRGGTFNVRGNQKDIIDYVTGFGTKDKGGRALGKEIRLPALKRFMHQSYADFQQLGQIGYGGGLLLTNYFLHLDGDGDGKRIKAFLKALHEGKEGDEALKILLDGRTYEQLQQDVSKAWSRKGIDFTFGKE